MKFGVTILPKNEVLDTQGRTVNDTLKDHGYKIKQCRVGRYVVLDFDLDSEQTALEEAKKITEFVLYNPLTETFNIEVIPS